MKAPHHDIAMVVVDVVVAWQCELGSLHIRKDQAAYGCSPLLAR